MANQFEIKVRNTIVKITVGGSEGQPQQRSLSTSSVSKAGGSGTGSSQDSGGGAPGSGEGCCCAPVVVGPIVLDASFMLGGNDQATGGSGTGSSQDSGGGTPGSSPNSGGSGTGSSQDSGGGEPSSSGCCPTVVIGPIVFTGNCSGQATSSDPSAAGVRVVTVDPPAHLGMTPYSATEKLPMTMQTQEVGNWCWSAVAVSVNDFLNHPTKWTQETFATELLNNPPSGDPPKPPLVCTMDPDKSGGCNVYGRLDVALTTTRNLRKNGFLENQRLAFACLTKWIDVQLPVCALISWRNGGAHFIALAGANTTAAGLQQVWVLDPAQDTPPQLWDYEMLSEHYGDSLLGFWQDTYLLTQ